MKFPENLRYTKEHEWVKLDGAIATIGITEFAQDALGELVFVELPSVGKSIQQGGTVCVVESTKAASDVYAPLSGKVKEVNPGLNDTPSLVNSNPYDQGWMVKLDGLNEAELKNLMTAADYAKFVEGGGH